LFYNIKNIILVVLLVVFSGLSVQAGSIEDKKRKKNTKKKTANYHSKNYKSKYYSAKKIIKKDDTTRVVINPDIFMDSVDSLLMFPSHDLYGNWDTTLIHPNLFDKQFTADSTSIYLLDDWSCGFTMPCKGLITSEFGWRRKRPHFGTDIDLETGDTVVASFDGKVRIATFNYGGYGNVVVIRHNNGLETVYGHLSKLLVNPGDEVTSGTIIGLGGNTGRSYGSHLHYEIRFLGKPIDSEDIIDYDKGEIKNSALVLYKEDFAKKYDLRTLHNHKQSKSHTVSKSQLNAGKTILVKNGDSLYKIAKRNNTTVAAICKKNGFKTNKVLKPGMRIKV